jgi:hypothetical protein
MLEQISFEWEMPSLPSSLQQVAEQISPMMSQQQHQVQDNLATLSIQLQEWTAQSATQLGVVQEVVATKLMAFHGTVSNFLNQCTEMATEKTRTWQAEGQAILKDLQRVTEQRSSEMRLQF